MKKILLVFICGFFFFGAPLYAQGTPGEIEVDFSVKNVSRDNQDGTAVSARPGDVLRYELQLSDEIAATDVQPRVNMSDVLTQANMVSNGGGALETGDLVFPMFSSVEICGATCPNWQKQYSYFVRVKEECDADAVTASIDGNELVVPLDCELTDSGPSGVFIAVGAMILLLGYVFLFQRKEG